MELDNSVYSILLCILYTNKLLSIAAVLCKDLFGKAERRSRIGANSRPWSPKSTLKTHTLNGNTKFENNVFIFIGPIDTEISKLSFNKSIRYRQNRNYIDLSKYFIDQHC